MEVSELLAKYNVPAPRYTSYPTVPFWNEAMHVQQWKKAFKNRFSISPFTARLYKFFQLKDQAPNFFNFLICKNK
jgi:hypothetical protein